MKRDWDLIRKILLKVEKQEVSPVPFSELVIEGYSDEQMFYHLVLLDEGGIVDVSFTNTWNRKDSFVHAWLSWRGYVTVGHKTWKRKLGRIILRDKSTCQLCFKKVIMDSRSQLGPSLDHIIPKSLGGSNGDANLQLAHWICNVRKGNKIIGQLRVC